MRLLRREICCLQHGEMESNVWNTFVRSCPTWPSRWGMHISIDWPRLKSCQAVCDECTRGEIYSSPSRDAGCLALWSWRESCVTKIWGSGAWSRIRVISFRYHGFPYSTIGDFLDPNIRVIRGPYCSCHYLVTAYFFWIENIPQDISCDTRDVLVQCIDSVIKTDIPDESDVELYQLVKRLQTHSHSKYFQKTPPSSGRFKFPFVLQTI